MAVLAHPNAIDRWASNLVNEVGRIEVALLPAAPDAFLPTFYVFLVRECHDGLAPNM